MPTTNVPPGFQEAMLVLSNHYELPGPFVVLQGIPGDGMANTIDTMPELNIGNKDNDHDDAQDNEHEHDHDHDHGSHSSRDQSESVEADFSIIAESTSETSSLELIIHSHSNTASPLPHSTNNTEIIAASSDITDSNMASATANVAATGSNEPSLHTVIRLSPRRVEPMGLHLPIPASAMGYNSILPPLSPPLQPRPEVTNIGRHHDSFIMIDGRRSINNSSSDDLGPSASSVSISSSNHSSSIDIGHCSPTNPRYATISEQDRQAIKTWNKTCHENERMQLNEVLMHSASPGGGSIASSLYRNQWWKNKRGCLLVFDAPPTFKTEFKAGSLVDRDMSNNGETLVKLGKIVGELTPGTTVLGIAKMTINSNGFERNRERVKNPQLGIIEVLKIESPQAGYVVSL
jgi:hypothetical protein